MCAVGTLQNWRFTWTSVCVCVRQRLVDVRNCCSRHSQHFHLKVFFPKFQHSIPPSRGRGPKITRVKCSIMTFIKIDTGLAKTGTVWGTVWGTVVVGVQNGGNVNVNEVETVICRNNAAKYFPIKSINETSSFHSFISANTFPCAARARPMRSSSIFSRFSSVSHRFVFQTLSIVDTTIRLQLYGNGKM